MSTPLTPEQRKRMEENRRIALEKRAARMAQAQNSSKASNSTGPNLNPNAAAFVPKALDFRKAPDPGFGSGSLTKHQNGFPMSPNKTFNGQSSGNGQQKTFNGQSSGTGQQKPFNSYKSLSSGPSKFSNESTKVRFSMKYLL